MIRARHWLAILLLAHSLVSGCNVPGTGAPLELRFSRKISTYRPSDRALIQVQDEFQVSATLGGDCKATLVQTVTSDPEERPRSYTLECAPVPSRADESQSEVELSLTDPSGADALVYRFRADAESTPALEAIRTSDGTEFIYEPIPEPDASDLQEFTDINPVSCGEVSLDLAARMGTTLTPTAPDSLRSFKLPADIKGLLDIKYIKKNDPTTPWTGIAPLDFLDPEALDAHQTPVLATTPFHTTIGIPCPYRATLSIRHAVQVPKTRISLAAFLDPESPQEWSLDYEENSFIHLDAEISGQIVPVPRESGLRWQLDPDSSVATRGQYQVRKEQLENLHLQAERKFLRTRIAGRGSFEKEMQLHELAESANLAPSGEVTLVLGSAPLEMQIHETREDLLSGHSSEETRVRAVFFPGRYTQAGWPSGTFEFTRHSEPRLGVRATLNDEADIPASWTSDIRLELER